MSLQQSTFLVSEGSGGIQGMAIGWHLGGELQVNILCAEGSGSDGKPRVLCSCAQRARKKCLTVDGHGCRSY